MPSLGPYIKLASIPALSDWSKQNKLDNRCTCVSSSHHAALCRKHKSALSFLRCSMRVARFSAWRHSEEGIIASSAVDCNLSNSLSMLRNCNHSPMWSSTSIHVLHRVDFSRIGDETPRAWSPWVEENACWDDVPFDAAISGYHAFGKSSSRRWDRSQVACQHCWWASENTLQDFPSLSCPLPARNSLATIIS